MGISLVEIEKFLLPKLFTFRVVHSTSSTGSNFFFDNKNFNMSIESDELKNSQNLLQSPMYIETTE